MTFSILLFLTLTGQLQAKTSNKITHTDISNAVKIEANKLLNDSRFSSVSIGVVSDSQAITEHFGELTKTQGNTPTDNTLYEIASVSKTMTGLIAAYAVSEGKLSLDENINVYIDNSMEQLSTKQTPVTIRELVTHTSGLPRDSAELGLTSETLTRSAFLMAVNRYDPSKTKGKYNYSSVGTELLSFILETIYQTPFDTLLQQVLSSKADMHNTKVNLDELALKNFAFGYDDKNEVAIAHIEHNVLWGGSGYIKSNMSDLTKYMKLQLQQQNPVITESHKKLFHVEGTDYLAYFWIAADDEQLGTYYIHHGGLESTQNWMIIFPKYNLAVSVISNSSFEAAAGLLRSAGMNIIKKLI